MSQITLNLPDKLAAELADVGRETSRSVEDVAQEMLQRMIVLRQFEKLRKDVREHLGPDAPTSEEEIFDQIS